MTPMTPVTARALLPFRPERVDGNQVLNYLPLAMYQTARSLVSIWRC